jgi:vacuolar-type H+-ATPase subunit H
MAPRVRTPYDTYAKDLAVALLTPYGTAESDARLASEPQFADVRFVLDPSHASAPPRDFLTAQREPLQLIEFAHDPPDLLEMMRWLRKQSAWWEALRKAAKRQKLELPRLPPTLRVFSAGDPVELREAFAMRPVPGSPGCYVGPPADTVYLVVIAQLPRTRATLLVRTMGSGATLREALAELAALPDDAPERTLAAPFVVRLRIELQHDPSPEAQETFMQAQKLYDELIQRTRREAEKEYGELIARTRRETEKEYAGLLEKQRTQGLQGLRTAIEQACSTRGLKLTSAHRAKLAAESDPDVLLRWHARALTVTRARDLFA